MLALIRTARRLQACLLLLFACSVAAAVASPLLADGPSPLMVVCSGGEMKLVPGALDGDAPAQPPHKLDCPLCLPLGMAGFPEFAVATPGPSADAACVGGSDTVRIPVPALRPPARAPPF